jgi:hypothetical protein
MIKNIRLLYFEGCPNYKDALLIIKEACGELNIPEGKIKIIKVNSLQEADKYRFLGSPTVQVNGLDIEESRTNDFPVFSCRLYPDNQNRGYPSRSMVKRAIIRNLHS